jgi:SSS family solute:Na+ symporter
MSPHKERGKNMFVKILLIIVFAAVTAAVGIYYNKKSRNIEGFVLGGREVGPWLTAFAYGTSYFSSVVFVGYAGQFGWNFGLAATWIGLGNAFIGSLMPWLILGRRTRIMTKHLNAATMPDFFAKRYKSNTFKIVASVIIFIFLIPYSASVYKGLSGLFSIAFGVDFIYCVVGIALLTGIYVIAGGYMATAVNDLIQGIIMLGGMCLVVFSVLAGKGGFTSAIEQLSQIVNPATPDLNGAFVSFFGPAPLALLSVVVLTSLGSWGLPQMVHKFYAIKSEKSIKSGAVISTLFALVIAGGSYFIGAFGRLNYSAETVSYDQIIPTMLSNNLSDVLIGIVLILVLSASMSTLSSLVITSSSTFVLDFWKSFGKKDQKTDAKKEMASIRILCAFFVILSAVIALNPNNLITSLMSLSWGALAGAFLGPFIYGLFMKKTTKAAVYASFAVGIAICVSNLFLKFTTPIAAGAFSILSSLVVVPLVSMITPKMRDEDIGEIFSCYEKTVTTKQRLVLDEKQSKAE